MTGADRASDRITDLEPTVRMALSAVRRSLDSLSAPEPPRDLRWTSRTVGRFRVETQQVRRPDRRDPTARLHRIDAADAVEPSAIANAPCLFVPGRFDRSEIYTEDPRRDVRLYLAAQGVHVFTMEHRRAVDEASLPAKGWRTADYMADLGACLAAIGVDRVVLIGHSMGAYLSYLASIAWPERVAGLAVLDGGLTSPGRGSQVDMIDIARVLNDADHRDDEWERMSASPTRLARLTRQAAAEDPESENALGRLLALPTRGRDGCLVGPTVDPEVVRAAGAYLATMDGVWPRRQTLEARLIALSGPGSWPDLELARLAETGGPRVFAALGVAGGSDRLLRNRHSATRADPNAKIVEVPGYGHLDVLFGPDVSAKVFAPLLRWLAVRRR